MGYLFVYAIIIAVTLYYGIHKQITLIIDSTHRRNIPKRLSVVIFSILLIIFTILKMIIGTYYMIIHYFR